MPPGSDVGVANSRPRPSTPAAERTRATPLSAAELQTLLDAWIAAQNASRFDAYAALYSTRFVGVKRVGEREFRMNQRAWLEDRKRMLQRGYVVAAREPHTVLAADHAVIEFTQHWTSGAFEDVGPKRLLIVREGGRPMIAHEELLRSDVISRLPRAKGVAALDFYFTVTTDGGFYMMMPDARIPGELGASHVEREESGTRVRVREVESARLDDAVQGMQGRRMRLEGGCEATITGFRVLGRVVAPDYKELSDEILAMGHDELAASLSSCTGRYAQSQASPLPIRSEAANDPALERLAREAFARLPQVLDQQRAFLNEVPDAKGLWWEPHIKIATYRHPRSQQRLISVLADNGGMCAEFTAGEWALFELKGTALRRLTPRTPPAQILDVMDVDGDGRLEFLTRGDPLLDEYQLISPDTDRPDLRIARVFFGCGC